MRRAAPAHSGRRGRRRSGFIVDSVSEVLKVRAEHIQAAPELSTEQMRLIGRVVNLEGARMILLIDPAQLLTEGEASASRAAEPSHAPDRFVIRLLIVDDSALMRKLLEGVFVRTATSRSACARRREALRLLHSFDPQVDHARRPDAGMDGLDLPEPDHAGGAAAGGDDLRADGEGAEATLEAMALGAVDFIAKPAARFRSRSNGCGRSCVEKVRAAAQARIRKTHALTERIRHRFRGRGAARPADEPRGEGTWTGRGAGVGPHWDVDRGTGRPGLRASPASGELPLANNGRAAHAGQLYRPFAKRLDRQCALRVVEVDRPLRLEAGTVYIGRGDADLVVARRSTGTSAMSVPAQRDYPWHPSVERLVSTALDHYDPNRLIGVMLTGMGRDGTDAMTRLYKAGGHTIAEAESTAVVWGMPGELVKNGGAGRSCRIEDVAREIIDHGGTPCRSLDGISPAHAPRPRTSAALRDALRSADPDMRWNARATLGADPAMSARWRPRSSTEPVPRVREAIMTALMRIGTRTASEALLPICAAGRGRRGAAIEALQALPDATAPFLSALLQDADSDVRILRSSSCVACRPQRRRACLCEVLAHEPHPNVCASAIDALAEVGTRDALPALEACARRFADTPFLPFAMSIAVARISDGKG
jgi:two-component system chemotaxis response regulator CheB